MKFSINNIFAIILSLIIFTSSVFANDYIIVVNKNAGISTISQSTLRQVFSAEKTAWSNGTDISLVQFTAGSELEKKFTMDVLGMSSDQAKKLYLKKVFAGVLSSPPEEADNTKEIIRLVKENEGAIGYLPEGSKTEGIVEVPIK